MRLAGIIKPIVIVAPGEGPTPLSDLVDGARIIPARLERYFALGGQSYQTRAGAITSWSVIFDGQPPDGVQEEAFELGVGLTEDEADPEFQLRLAVGEDHVWVPVVYPRRVLASTLNLTILALTGQVRLDFFLRDRDRAFHHKRQSGFCH
jgi:hypothetical protein